MTTTDTTPDVIQWVKPPRPELPRLYYRPMEIAAVTGLSKSKVYEALASGRLRSFLVDGSRLIAIDDVHAWIQGDSLESEEQ